jgi:hypothetical protein
MTWRELKQYIDDKCEAFIDSEVKIYDYEDGSEFATDITELLCSDDEDDDNEGGWVPYLTINHEEFDSENETA